MSTGDVNARLLRKASVWSYVMGIWQLLSVIVLLAAVALLVAPVLSMMGPLPAPELVDLIYSFLNSLFLAIAIVMAITVPITLIFGIYAYKVGGLYNTGSLKLTGASAIITSLGYPILVYGLYQFLGMLAAMLPTPPADFGPRILNSLGLLLAGAGIVVLFTFIFYIAFIVAASGMKTKTGISDFSTAMWLSIIGLFIQVTFPIAIIIFGSGLSKLSRLGEAKPSTAATTTAAPKAQARRETVYCPYCGAKVERDSLFCQSCGSSLKKEE